MLPDFLIIGAMKCATSTLHEQLARQPGFFMSEPKEPYFFSDDPIYARGIAWYAALFAEAQPGVLCGESTTHYTKLPTYPHTVARIQHHLPDARFIYVMRHPIDRLVSQYIHQWTEREIDVPIDVALQKHPELIAYSRYTLQLAPYFAAFGKERVLPVFFDRVHAYPQQTLEHVCRFLGYAGQPHWQSDVDQQNKSAERMRSNPLRDKIVYAPILRSLRQQLVPPAVRNRIKSLWQMRQRPSLTSENVQWLTAIFDEDLATLGRWLHVELSCKNFKAITREQELAWSVTTEFV
jgi:hypothetical protein